MFPTGEKPAPLRCGLLSKFFDRLLIIVKKHISFLATGYYTKGRGTLGCKACVEIYAQLPMQTSRKIAQLIMSSEFSVILPGRYLSTC